MLSPACPLLLLLTATMLAKVLAPRHYIVLHSREPFHPCNILLSWGEENNDGKKTSNFLAEDMSVGDTKTTLHKAVEGGRSLAVQLLMSALKQRQLLEEAFQTKDASGLTPLELAK